MCVGLIAVPQAFQPVPGSSLAGQTDGVDTSLFDTYTLANPAPRVVIGQNGALLQLQALIELLQPFALRRDQAAGVDLQCGVVHAR